jgi:hypothetical protein
VSRCLLVFSNSCAGQCAAFVNRMNRVCPALPSDITSTPAGTRLQECRRVTVAVDFSAI